MSEPTPDPAATDSPAPDSPAPDLADAARESEDPAFDIDLDPEDQGTAAAAAEPSG